MATDPTARRARVSTLTVTLCCLVGVFEGYDLQVAGVAAPKLAPAFGMTPSELSLFFSASTFGLMLGAILGGRLSDRFGRKTVLLASVTIFGLMSILNGLATSVDQLLIFRFLTGVGLGGALPNLLALVAENSAPARRNTMLGLLYAGLPTGGAIVSLLSLFGGAANWQIAFHVGGLAPLLVVPLMLWILPDSVAQAARTTDSERSGFIASLFGGGRASVTICLWISFFLALLTLYVLLNWLPSLLVERGLSRPQASIVQLVFNILAAVGSIVTGLLMDRLKLTTVVVVAFAAAAAGLVVLAGSPADFGIALAAGGFVGATISMTQALLYAVAPASYPTEIRGTGVGAGVSAGRSGSAAGPLLVGVLLTGGASPQLVLSVLAPAIAVAGLAAFGIARALRPKPG